MSISISELALGNGVLSLPVSGQEIAGREGSSCEDSSLLFESMAEDLQNQGYSIKPAALPLALSIQLQAHLQAMQAAQFSQAGIGRGDELTVSQFVRKDEICWINGESEAGRAWLAWAEQLRQFLNRQLYLGLFSFESHFAHYRPGDFYKRHVDAFKGEANRVLSMVTYLNPGWTQDDAGELVLYQNDHDQQGIKVTPLLGTIALFLSEDFPHEVLPALRDRYSIAGWFRVNASINGRVDPPR